MIQYGTPLFGNITVGATAIQLTNGLTTGLHNVEVDIRADIDNGTGNYIVVGLSSVTTTTPGNGWILKPGEGKVITIADPDLLYVRGSTAGLKLSYHINY